MRRYAVAPVALLLLLALPVRALGQDPLAERTRLEDELVKLAQRNTWTGVDRTYRRLLDLGVALEPQDHWLGGQAALARGDTLTGWYRLRRAERAEAGVDAIQRDALDSARHELEAIESRYGLVSIYVGLDAVPVLFRDAMPFVQQERDAIVAAQQVISKVRAFRGFLPVGNYAIDGVKFEVVPGTEWLVVSIGHR
jgi:hypothetical protein